MWTRRGRRLQAGLSVSLLLVAAFAAHAGEDVDVQERIDRYVVDGRNDRDWHASMRAKGPRDPVTGQRYSGSTQWEVVWSWDTYPTGDGICQLGGHQVQLRIRTTLPEWPGRDRADRIQREHWDALYRRLSDHEAIHRDNAIAAAHAVDGIFDAMRNPEPCAGMRRRIDHRVRQLLDGFHAIDRRVDRETRHGRIGP